MEKKIINIKIGECTYSLIKTLQKRFGYESEADLILDLLYECWQYHVNIPVNHSGNSPEEEHKRNMILSELKFFE